MAMNKIKVPMPGGKTGEGSEVLIEESNERWSELKLEDGAIIRVKQVVSQVMRVEGEYDPEGNPIYAVKSAPAVSIVSVPERLRKKMQ
jgi:transposase